MSGTQKSSYITILIIVAIIVLAATVTFWRVTSQSNSAAQTAAEAAVAPLFAGTYTDLDGNPVDLGDYDDRVRVVNAWATWCPFCVEEIPDFIALANEYDPEEVVVLLINRKESAATVRSYLESIGVTDLGNVVFIQDPDDSFYKGIGGFTMPETIFWQADDIIATHKRGFMKFDEMKALVEAARTN